MRFHPTRGAMTIGQSKGGLPPDEVCEEQAAVLKDMERVIAEFHDNSKCAAMYPTCQHALGRARHGSRRAHGTPNCSLTAWMPSCL